MRLRSLAEAITSQYPVRISTGQKKRFREFLIKELNSYGLQAEDVAGGTIVKTVNLLTQVDQPKVIIMAHYDTAGSYPLGMSQVLRWFGHGAAKWIGFLFGFSLRPVARFVAELLSRTGANPLSDRTTFLIIVLLILSPMFVPNKSTSNDNTSGVLTLLSVGKELAQDPHLANNVMLAFVDMEELGLWGSRHLRTLLTKRGVDLNQVDVINIDCVGAGEIPMVCYAAGPSPLAQRLYKQLQESRPETRLTDMSLSDHHSFREFGSVGIIYADAIGAGQRYIIPNIHSSRDRLLNYGGMEWLSQELLNYVKQRCKAE